MAETETEINLFFPTPIQVSEIADTAEMNARMLKEIYEIRASTPSGRPDTWIHEVYTTLNTDSLLHERPAFRDLKRIILEETTKFAEVLKIDLKNYELKITSCWANIYGERDAQEPHIHANNIFSGIYYAQAPEGSSGVVFHSPLADVMLNPPYTEINSLNHQAIGFDAVPGRMVIFRSWLRHSVKTNRSKGDRISIAFNMTI
jgi:uncharacterized protein (TIGR02466 family)